jgi:hypothetical protein
MSKRKRPERVDKSPRGKESRSKQTKEMSAKYTLDQSKVITQGIDSYLGDDNSASRFLLSHEKHPLNELILTNPNNLIFKDESTLAVTVGSNLINEDNNVLRLCNAQNIDFEPTNALRISVSDALINENPSFITDSNLGISIHDHGNNFIISQPNYLSNLGVEPLVVSDYEGSILSQNSVDIPVDKVLKVTSYDNIIAEDSNLYCITPRDDIFLRDRTHIEYLKTDSILVSGSSLLKYGKDDRILIDSGLSQGFLSDYSSVESVFTKTQDILSSVQISNIGSTFLLDESWKATLQDRFLGFSESYSALFLPTSGGQANIACLPEEIALHVPSEYLYGLELATSFSYDLLSQQLHGEIVTTQEGYFEKLLKYLSDLDPSMPDMLIGARQALNSKNVDRVRHFAASLRELFTHVLHRLSPNEEIRKWSSADEHYVNGKPTRRARLLYICKDIDSHSFSRFVRADVDSILTFLNLFQEGTHKIKAGYSDTQLRAMLLKMESTIKYLCEISRI